MQGRTCLNFFTAAGVFVDAVRDALPGLAVPAVLAVAANGSAEPDGHSGVVLQLFERQIEACVLHRLNEKFIHHRPDDGSCTQAANFKF